MNDFASNPIGSLFSAAKSVMGFQDTQTSTHTITVNGRQLTVQMTLPASMKKEDVEKMFSDNKSEIENTAAALMFKKDGTIKERQVSIVTNINTHESKITRIIPGILWNDKKDVSEEKIQEKIKKRQAWFKPREGKAHSSSKPQNIPHPQPFRESTGMKKEPTITNWDPDEVELESI